ncbi:hypothetical protein AX17_005043 [Amanita inopinata Kibby_2008]|nr:hypothetical protein AX17_005043 [Amanita inopinata Kibby_2008]
MAAHYFQLAGFQPSIFWFRYDEKSLAAAVAGPDSPLRSLNSPQSPVELILGIKHSGTSHLLLTADQARTIAACFRLESPRRGIYFPTDFESLSPITFNDAEELGKKFTVLKPKSQKNREAYDNSQANKQFVDRAEGIGRGAFEHGRVFYHILHDALDIGTYGLPEPGWPSIRISSLVFNTTGNDTRPGRERLSDPILLDIGWSEASVPDLKAKPGSSKHYSIREHRFMSHGSEKTAFNHGSSEEIDRANVSLRLQEAFGDRTQSTTEPTLLLVHDEQLTRNALRKFGVDTSSWESGIKKLLGHPADKIKYEMSPPRERNAARNWVKKEEDESSDRLYNSRSKSPSPRRPIKPDPDGPVPRNNSQRPISPPRRGGGPSRYYSRGSRTYAPVYVVDMKELYVKMMQTVSGAESVVQIAQRFSMRDEGKDEWCAGNEAVLLFDIWHSMISGPPIDEQTAARMAGWTDVPSATAAAPVPDQPKQEQVDDDMDDDERDPNDIVYDIGAGSSVIKQTRQAPMYNSEDSDYGSESD